jgi:hypothetical protein
LGTAAPDLATLRDSWRQRSLASGWHAADDWHNRAVDAVAEAALPGTQLPGTQPAGTQPAGTQPAGLARACGALGRARARAGVGVAETIADLAALYAALDRDTPPLPLVSSLAAGWAEEGLARQARARCEDPLTGLATVPYLRTRLAEVYREAEQLGVSPAHRLVVVTPATRPDPWRRLSADILLGHDLRAAFPGGDTLTQSAVSGAGIALIAARPDTAVRYARLRRAVEFGYGARIHMCTLPAVLSEALRLVDELAH